MIYVFLANGFEEMEAVTPIDFLRRCELEVRTVGIGGRLVMGSHRIVVAADLEESEFDPSDLDAMILPGGMPGTLNLEKSRTVQDAIRWTFERQKLLAAICAAPSILGHLGLLENRGATCFPGYEQELRGARLSSEKVVRDGNIITAAGAGVSIGFAAAVAEHFVSRENVERVLASIQCR